MLAGEFGDVALQVFRAHLVERTVMRPLEHRPKALDPVRVGLTPHVFGDGVIDRLVLEIVHPSICRRVVRVDGRSGLDMLADEALERSAVRALDDFGPDLVAITILHADYRRLADRATALVHRLALLDAHVPPFAAEIGLVDFHRPVEILVVVFRPGFPDAMQHEPRGRLRHADVALQLHGRYRLEVRQAQVDRNRPLPQRDVRPRDRCARADGEVGPAIRAPIGHRLRVRNLASAGRSALAAVPFAVRPDRRLKPLGRGFIGREHVHQFDDGESLTMRFAGCLLRHFCSLFQHVGYGEC